MGASFIWLTAMLAQGVAGSLDVSDTQRAYVRESIAGDDVSIDLENVPRAELALDWPTSSLVFDYAPHLFWSEVTGPGPSPTLLLHTGGVRLSSRSERLTASIGQTFAVGDQSFARITSEEATAVEPMDPATGTPASPELDLLPGATVVRVLETQSSASLRYHWSRRVSTELRPSFSVSGGADREAQRILPRERRANVETLLDYRASRRDVLTSSAAVMQSSVSNGYDHLLLSFMETWSRSFAPLTGAAIGAGLAVSETTGPMVSSDVQGRLVGVARAWHAVLTRSSRTELQAEVGHQPHVNVLTGSLQGRLYATAGATVTAGSSSARIGLGATQTLPTDAPDSAQSLTADLVLGQGIFDWLSAELGGQMTWQSLGGQSVLERSDSLWLVFAGARAELPTIRF